ncbi:MAG: selenide, water dikinase SelD [Gammaproteobacteria bacterium]|nr:selenide, water dikinase SelD [Gammaproteobacteria bacterium]
MDTNNSPVVKDLVLVGGGHAHVGVLRQFAMNPIAGLRITLITRDIHTPYSGMLPGYIAGHYDYDDCHIDLGPLARFAGARLYHAEVSDIDLDKKQIFVTKESVAGDRPPISYDLLSINTGSRPSAVNVMGVAEHAISAKPIDIFLQRWQKVVDEIKQISSHHSKKTTQQAHYKLTIVGGGAGGIELALATQHRLQELLREQKCNPDLLSMTLINSDSDILSSHNQGVRKIFSRVLKKRKINLINNTQVTEVTKDQIKTSTGETLSSNAVIWVTHASAPAWIKEAGLDVDPQGFICVNEYLQSTSHEGVYATGDIASLPDPRPKSGVFAVRQGPFLADNLCASLTTGIYKAYKPQKDFLGLISTGDKHAVASRGQWSFQSDWLWRIKDWIDRSFMKKFSQLPQMEHQDHPELAEGIADDAAIKELSTMAMRCGGCGAKVAASVLSRVMEKLPATQRDDVLIGRDAPDDCAMLSVPQGKVMVQSVDYFRSFIDDNYIFGAIAANHALGDLYAMGAEAQSVLAIATVPYGREKIVEDTLYEVLSGALSIIEPTGAVLAGGHSSEGAELAFGLTVNGLVDPNGVWRKGGMRAGDKLILTKAIGTGTLFAAEMRHQAKGRWIDGAIQSMLLSSQNAAHCLREHQASACTDLTGFGLVGHLVEMTRASDVDVKLDLGAIPILDGALETVKAGILSSLQPSNLRLRRAIADIEKVSGQTQYPLLFDPQTAGGLMATVAQEQADACVSALKLLGYSDSAIIGEIQERGDQSELIHLNF